MTSATYLFFAWGTVGWFVALSVAAAFARDFRQSVIAGLFAISNAVIFLWR